MPGLEEPLYALADAAGSTTAVVNSGGQVVERYVYDMDGRPEARRGQLPGPNGATGDWESWPTFTNLFEYAPTVSHADWTVLYRGQRWNQVFSATAMLPCGLYESNGQWYDPQYGRSVQVDPWAFVEGRNAYDSGISDVYAWIATGARIVSWINPVVGVIVNTVVSTVERTQAGEEGWAAFTHGFGDAIGYTSAMRGINNVDPYTGEQLNLSLGQRLLEGVSGITQMAGLGLSAAGGIARSGGMLLKGRSFPMPTIVRLATAGGHGKGALAIAWTTAGTQGLSKALTGLGGELSALGGRMGQIGGIGTAIFRTSGARPGETAPKASGVLGTVPVPTGVHFGSPQFGDAMHEAITDWLIAKFGPVFRKLRGKRGQKGIDVEVEEALIKKMGFRYAEIKPCSISGENTFNAQVVRWDLKDKWGNRYKVRAYTYDAAGNIRDGF